MPQPANQTNNQPNQPTILEQAKQGQPEAVAALINRSLQPKGLEATAQRQGDYLEIVLSSAQVPNPKATTALIQRGMTILQAEGLRRVKVKSCRSDGSTVAWEQEFTIAAEVKINADGVARETLSNKSAQRINITQSQSRDSATDMIADRPLNSASSVPAEPKGQPHESTINQSHNPGNSMMAANTANFNLGIINPQLTNSGLTLIQSQIQDDSPEYQDIVVRFMTETSTDQGERKTRCLTTLSELLQIINKSAFAFRSVSNNPHLQYLLETIADCTVTDEQGDQVLQNMMILQPGYSWQPVNLRLVTKAYIEPAQIITGTKSSALHQGITVDMAESPAAPSRRIVDALPPKVTASWHDSDTSISEAEKSVEELTEIPQASVDDTLEDFLNDFVPAVQTSSQIISQITSPLTQGEEDWRVAASTTAEISEITTIPASPSVTDSLADFLGDFIAEPDLSVVSGNKSSTEVAVRTIKSITTKADDVFGDMWETNLGEDSATSLPSELALNQEVSHNLESKLESKSLAVKPESDKPQVMATNSNFEIASPKPKGNDTSNLSDANDDLDIGWDLPEPKTVFPNPLIDKILAVNVDDIIQPVAPNPIPELGEDLVDPLFTQLMAADSSVSISVNNSVNNSLDSISELPSIAEDDLFGNFAAQASSTMSSIMDELKIDELDELKVPHHPMPDTLPLQSLAVNEIEIRESVDDSNYIEHNDSEDVFGGWDIATNTLSKSTAEIEVIEAISQDPIADLTTSEIPAVSLVSGAPVGSSMAQSEQLNANITANSVNSKSNSVLASEIAEIMATHKTAETQSNNISGDSLFNDFVFAIDFNSDSQSDNHNLLENHNPNWQNNEHPPIRLSVSGLSDEITL